MTDHQMNLDPITVVFDLLDRHGYTRGDHEHTGRPIVLTDNLARIYEGAPDHPFGPPTSTRVYPRRWAGRRR